MNPTHSVGYLLQHIAGTLSRQSDQVLQERLGLGMAQYRILMIVQWHPGLGQRQLADCLGQTEASISRQVKLLHEKGLLTTEVDPAERRRHITKPSAKGVKITEAAREVLNTYQAPLLHGMTDKQQAQFLRTLTTLHERICAPGRPMICDQPFDIETVYASQQ